MTVQRRRRIVIGLILIAVDIGIGVYCTTTTTRIVSVPSEQRDTPLNDFAVTFGTEVQEKAVKVDLRGRVDPEFRISPCQGQRETSGIHV